MIIFADPLKSQYLKLKDVLILNHGEISLEDMIFSVENWVGVFVGVLVSMWYYLQKGLQCCSLLHLADNKKLTGNEPFLMIICSYILNVVVAFGVVLVLYGAIDGRQFGFASISLISLISGHMSFTEFRKLNGVGDS